MYFVPIHQNKAYPQIQGNLELLRAKKTHPKQILQILQNFQNITSKSTYNQNNYQDNRKYDPYQHSNNYGNKRLQNMDHRGYQQYDHRNSHYDNNYSKGNNNHYNQQKQSRIRYTQLQNRYFNELPEIFGNIAGVVLNMAHSKNKLKIPILTSGNNKPLELLKGQVVYLLSLMALNLVPEQQYHNSNKAQRFNKNRNFSYIFQDQQYKTRSIIEYFKMIFKFKYDPSQVFILGRNSQDSNIDFIIKKNDQKQMSQCHIADKRASIEDYYGCMKADFANKMIGGGALTKGLVQEEIMFANHPEMYISTLLCQSMKDNEAICFTGFKKYFNNDGYGYGAKYGGTDQKSLTQLKKQYIIAIDAIDFKNEQRSQYERNKIDRQIIKAYTGFNMLKHVPYVATGNWGCGAFKGDVKLKFIIQWIACTLAKKVMHYCPYGQDRQFQRFIKQISDFKRLAPSQMYGLLIRSVKQMSKYNHDIFDLMYNNMKGHKEQNYGNQRYQHKQRNREYDGYNAKNYNNNYKNNVNSPYDHYEQDRGNNRGNVRGNSMNNRSPVHQPYNKNYKQTRL